MWTDVVIADRNQSHTQVTTPAQTIRSNKFRFLSGGIFCWTLRSMHYGVENLRQTVLLPSEVQFQAGKQFAMPHGMHNPLDV